MNKILIIDGNSIFFRAYYGSAYARQGILKTSKGIPINGILTFNNMINKYIRRYSPSHIFIAFDSREETFRKKEYPEYKAGRQKMPDEMKVQWPILFEMLDQMKLSYHKEPGIEADDLIGIITERFSKDNKIMILSSDKDLYQLIRENVYMIVPQAGELPDKVVNIDNIEEHLGVQPNQVIDYKALVGDPSDNLPGVKGIGPKTAIPLIKEYGNLDNIYNNIDKLKPSVKSKLVEHKETAYLTRSLATLLLDHEYEIPLDQIKFDYSITQELIDFYKKYDLNSLVNKYKDYV